MPGVEELATLEGMSIAGTNTGLEGTDMPGTSSRGEGTSVASSGTGSVEMSINDSHSYIREETGSVMEDIPGTGGKKTTAETTAETNVDSSQRISQEILGDFAEDWLVSLDKDGIKSISLFLCYHFMHAFSVTETKAAKFVASMVKKSKQTVRQWRSALINIDGVLPESEQEHYIPTKQCSFPRAVPTKQCSLTK